MKEMQGCLCMPSICIPGDACSISRQEREIDYEEGVSAISRRIQQGRYPLRLLYG